MSEKKENMAWTDLMNQDLAGFQIMKCFTLVREVRHISTLVLNDGKMFVCTDKDLIDEIKNNIPDGRQSIVATGILLTKKCSEHGFLLDGETG